MINGRWIRVLIGLGAILVASVTLGVLLKQGGVEANMDMDTRTWCIGRYSVEIPTDFELRSIRTPIGLPRAFEVENLGPQSEKEAKARIDARRAALTKGVEEGSGYYRLGDTYQTGDITVLGLKIYDPLLPTLNIPTTDAEAYVIRHGNLFRIRADAFNEISDMVQPGSPPRQVGLMDIVNAVSPLPSDGGLGRSGICNETSFISLPVVSDSAYATFQSNKYQMSTLSFEFTEEAESPTDKREGFLVLPGPQGITLDGIPGQTRVSDDQKQRLRRYEAEAIEGGAIGAAYRSIRVGFGSQASDSDQPALSANDMDAVWRIVTSSIERR